MYEVIPVPTSSCGFTSTRSNPIILACCANTDKESLSSAYVIPFGSADTHPGTNGRSSTSISILTYTGASFGTNVDIPFGPIS